jgi:hypothetical protein
MTTVVFLPILGVGAVLVVLVVVGIVVAVTYASREERGGK